MNCPKCASEEHIKSGHIRGKQRYKCKSCRHQFTLEDQRSIDINIRAVAVILCAGGMPFCAIAGVLNVSHTSVMN
jgi:transposase-like protein